LNTEERAVSEQSTKPEPNPGVTLAGAGLVVLLAGGVLFAVRHAGEARRRGAREERAARAARAAREAQAAKEAEQARINRELLEKDIPGCIDAYIRHVQDGNFEWARDDAGFIALVYGENGDAVNQRRWLDRWNEANDRLEPQWQLPHR
jgi:hypothetical protein